MWKAWKRTNQTQAKMPLCISILRFLEMWQPLIMKVILALCGTKFHNLAIIPNGQRLLLPPPVEASEPQLFPWGCSKIYHGHDTFLSQWSLLPGSPICHHLGSCENCTSCNPRWQHLGNLGRGCWEHPAVPLWARCGTLNLGTTTLEERQFKKYTEGKTCVYR